MFRILLRSLAINMASVYIVAKVLSGVVTFGSFRTLVIASLAIAVINLFVRPIVNLLLLPIHLLTLGIFRWVANLATLLLVTRFIPDFQVHSFYFPGLNLSFLIIPPVNFSVFGAFVVTTLVLTITFHFIYWLLQD